MSNPPKRVRTYRARGGGLRGAVVATVLRLGPCTIKQVLSAIGHTIPAAQASQAGRKRWLRDGKRCKQRKIIGEPSLTALLQIGRYELIRSSLSIAYRKGQLSKVDRGVYAPPKPKLYQPGQAG